uniref:Uncharacterized protein n=1 Tax=Strongyloides venezuelensis TaxID=75913 RepID=A0A0K0FFY2_STRVS
MDDKEIVIGLIIFLVVFLLICGFGGYYYYKKSGQSKSKRRSSRSSRRKGKSKSRSRSKSSSSSRRSRSSKSRKVPVPPQKNTPEVRNTDEASGDPKKKGKLEGNNNYSGSLLTSNNLTYNTVNIMVNKNPYEDINEVIENAVNAIPDPNFNLSDVPGLPPSTKNNNNHDLESN